MFLYSMVSSPLDWSKRFTLHPMTDMFIPTSFRLLWEAFSHVVITARRLFVQISLSVCSQVLILNEIAKALKRQQKDSRVVSIENPVF